MLFGKRRARIVEELNAASELWRRRGGRWSLRDEATRRMC